MGEGGREKGKRREGKGREGKGTGRTPHCFLDKSNPDYDRDFYHIDL